MMWKPVVGRNVYAQGGYVQDLLKQNPGMEKDSTVKMALSDEQEREKFFAPDPNMYRDPAKNMKNVQEYIQDQGVELVGKRQKPTAADLLGKFQEGQSAGEAMEQSAAPTAPTPAAPAAPPQRSGGLGMNLDNSMELSALSAPSSGLSGASPAGISTGLGLDPSRPGMFRKGGAVMDYRQGGPVAGGPPGVDTVPAMLNNGEYVLPRPTTQAMGGKPALDRAVIATTGKPPVGYAAGGVAAADMPYTMPYDRDILRREVGMNDFGLAGISSQDKLAIANLQMQANKELENRFANEDKIRYGEGYADGGQVSGWNVDRAKQIEDAVDAAMGQPPIAAPAPQGPQVAPLLTPDEQAWMEMQQAKEAEQMVKQKPAWKRMLGMARGGEVQGYARGGGPLSPAAQAALDEFNARVAQQRAVASAATVAGPKPINMGGPAPTTMVEPPLTPRSAEYIRMQPAAPAPQATPAPSLRDVGPRQPSPEAQRYIAAREVANARGAAAATPTATPSTPAIGWNRSINIPGGQMATNLVKGAAGLLKNNVIAAPAIGGVYSAYESATNPEAVNAFRESVGAETPWQNVGADALRTLGNIGNTATFGLAGRLGQGIANVIGGQSFFTPEAAAAQPAPPVTTTPPLTPTEIATAETQAAIMDPAKGFAQVPGAVRQGLEYAPNYEKTITPGQLGARYSGPQGYMEYAGPAQVRPRSATPDEIQQDLSAPRGSRLVASGGVRGMGDGSSPLGFDKATMDAANANIRRGGGGGSFSVVGGAPAGVDDAAYAAMSPAQKSAAKVASLQQQWQAVRDLRNTAREGRGLPRVEQVGRGEGLKPSEQIALANLQRNLVQDEFGNRIRGEERLEGRQKARNEVQDRYLKQAEPFVQKLSADFPWMGEEAPTFFQQAATIRPTNPAAAVNMLAGVQQALAGNNEPLFKLGDIEVTGAQAVALLNGEEPFNTWMPFGSPNAETYKALRQRAAQEVQRMALRELGR